MKRHPFFRALRNCLKPLVPRYPRPLLGNYLRFWRTYRDYARLAGRKPCALSDLDPQIGDWQSVTPISYYFYQDTWAFHRIAQAQPRFHVDVGSTALLVGCLAGVVPTLSVDVRPLAVRVPGLQTAGGLITQLPFRSGSLASVSALCVIEHIGLGRYGDPLDPRGTEQAGCELARVLAPGGRLYVSAPCGRSYIAFNAHRSFSREEIEGLFPGLQVEEFQMINNLGFTDSFSERAEAGLHVGLFIFRK